MAYPSEALARQFTLIERDALNEVDWRELIDLRWKQSSTAKPTWPHVLEASREGDLSNMPGGVDLCIARFNIMVKWATSEVCLVEDPNERAACIVKYIHIAQHARRMQNWTTMYQITTSLASGDVSRLKQTWELVPSHEREVLKHLEALITPVRNFHNLRMEMENGAANVETGCIPFVGLFTHDLIYNAQKPAYAAPLDPTDNRQTDQLINFERYRTAAGIVKNLLRLCDASTRYEIEPQPEILSRCLWMSTLEDSEISRRSRLLEV